FGSGGFGGVQPPPSRSIQIGFVIAYGVVMCVRGGRSLPVIGSVDRSMPAASAPRMIVASSGGNSVAEMTGNMLPLPVTSATTQLSVVGVTVTLVENSLPLPIGILATTALFMYTVRWSTFAQLGARTWISTVAGPALVTISPIPLPLIVMSMNGAF